jgi:hypothetical protein
MVLGLALIALGVAIGPLGLRVLSDSILASLDPAVSVAVATIGVRIGIDVNSRYLQDREARIERIVVATIVILGAVATLWLHTETTMSALSILGQTIAIAMVIAALAWLLVSQTGSGGEQRVFTLGALLLLGGLTVSASLSALLGGFIAGMCWSVARSPTLEYLERDVRYFQHPLTVLLLIVSGGRLDVLAAAVGLLGARVIFDLGTAAATPGVVDGAAGSTAAAR